jgi:transposase
MVYKISLAAKLIIKFIEENKYIHKQFYFKDTQRKYSLVECIDEILYVNKTGIAWRDIRSHIPYETLYKTFKKMNSLGIFQLCHKDLLLKYIKKSSNLKLKYIITDTSFIPNKKGEDCVGYNKFYNRKKGTKISLITDAKGAPLNVECYRGNMHDSKILMNQLNHFNTVYDNHELRDKATFLADPAYDCANIRRKLKEMDFDVLIHQNKRNIKDSTKIIKMNYKQKKLYKKRLRVELAINKLKMNRRLMIRYEKKIESFKGFIYLSLIKMLC